jgi:hypothetical protein
MDVRDDQVEVNEEPFAAGTPEIIGVLVSGFSDAGKRFALCFSPISRFRGTK